MAVLHALAARAAGLRVHAVASAGGTSARHLAGQLDGRRCRPGELPAGAEILIVATPPGSHLALALQGIASGARVLIEKPVTTTLSEADRLVAAAHAPGAPRVRVAENLLHSPLWRAAAAHRPGMGTLGHLSLRIVQPPPEWGHFRQPLTAGGVLFVLGPHPVALALELAGEAPTAVAATLGSSRPDGADDHAEVRIRFGSGLVAEMVVSWRGEDAHWGIQAASDTGVLRLELVPEAVLEIDGEEVPVAGRFAVPDPRIESMGYVDQLVDLVGEDPTAGQSVEAARDVLEVICAAYASAGSGGAEVTLPFGGDRDRVPLELWRV